MEERIIVSGGDELSEAREGGRRIFLEGAGVLLAAGDQLYAASDWGDMIWRLDGRTLVPTGLFAGGPGICGLLLSRDGARLYALCGEADSLLMLSAGNGAPIMINRVGVSPCAMTLDETGEMIAVAGGACGEVVLLSSKTLNVTARLQTCGMVFGVLVSGGNVYALSLDETMNSVFTAFLPGGKRRTLALPGMPGTLAAISGQIAAATHEGLFFLSADGSRVLARLPVPGRAGRLLESDAGLIMTDVWSEGLFLRGKDGRWRQLAERVRDAVVIT